MAAMVPAARRPRPPRRPPPVDKRRSTPALWTPGGRRRPRAHLRWPHGARPTAAFFDLDKTIIAKSSTLAFSKPFQAGGLISRRAVLRSAYAQFVYLVGGADHDQMEKMRQFMSQLCAGWDVATVREIVADTLHNIVDPLVYDEAVVLIEEHRLAGRDVVIVSTSGTEVVEPIGEMLGADRVVATRMEIVDGRYTGEIEYYAYAEEKARAIRELADERRLRPRAQLRLQRLGHRRADARGGRPPARRQPGPGAAPGRGRPRLAGAGLHQAGRAARAGCRCRPPGRPSPRWPSAASSPSAACCGPTPARVASGPDRPAPTAPKSTLADCAGTGVHTRTELHSQHVSRVPTRRSTLPTGRWPPGHSRDRS